MTNLPKVSFIVFVLALLLANLGCGHSRDDYEYNYEPPAEYSLPEELIIRPSGNVLTISAGSTLELQALGRFEYQGAYYYKPVQPVWSIKSGPGAIEENGQYLSNQAGTAIISASLEGITETKIIAVINPSGITTEVFSDNAESGLISWEVVGFSASDIRAHSGKISFYSGAGNNLNNILQMKNPIAISGSEILCFWSYYKAETSYDYLIVEVSQDGYSWAPLVFFSGEKLDWSQESIGLNAYAGKWIYIRFRYLTDSTNCYLGFFLDDIVVER